MHDDDGPPGWFIAIAIAGVAVPVLASVFVLLILYKLAMALIRYLESGLGV